ncbi:ectoine/hydroxyectoine ABC transporter permease subunit EhuD [Paracoccus sp. pheM1]|uniref:ectoine/hydroxyectoine ABC transporter permease subunit EhuD n=1 Tax=Paracoccus sp. pheM1 TaxID=2831675 RepID=UPI001BDB81D8|nr:ectoine/hydroxyectoine ABC transporter permease subunit EhuD [Paracoccus sp. pheM1]MBT0781458.1 ectoine/hydroxyectoine ABC transporter permease subunit EhuD [Paracoccus sp. pheM1]
MNWDWTYVREILPRLMEGLAITVQATGLATLLALFVGLGFALMRRSDNRWISRTGYWTVEFIRRTPLLIQLYFVFYILPDIGLKFSALTCGVLALGLHTSAYMSEVYRAGIEAVPKGQWEATRALNLPRFRTWREIILPQAIPPMIPALGNYVIMMFKESALLSTIAVLELMGTARLLASETYRYFEPITMVGIIFLIVSLPTAIALRVLETRLARRVSAGS